MEDIRRAEEPSEVQDRAQEQDEGSAIGKFKTAAERDAAYAALEKEFKARSDTLLTPVQFRINESLKAFANASGATVVLDGARFNGAVLAMKAGTDPASLDLTTAFIDSYNKAHP